MCVCVFLIVSRRADALAFVYFSSWPGILTALPAVMAASRRWETRS